MERHRLLSVARGVAWIIGLAGAASVGALIGAGCSVDRDWRLNRAAASDSPPRDFGLSVTVEAADSSAAARSIIRPGVGDLSGGVGLTAGARYGVAGVKDLPPARRPARYIVEADWLLRAAVGFGSREESFPPPTRQLDAAQMSRLWRVCRDANLLAPNHPALVPAAPRSEAPTDSTRYIVSIRAAEHQRTLVMVLPDTAAGDAPDSPTRLVQELAALAWMTPGEESK